MASYDAPQPRGRNEERATAFGANSLSGEVREQVDLFVGEGTNFWTVNCYCTDRLIVFEHWHCDDGTKFYCVNRSGVAFTVGLRR